MKRILVSLVVVVCLCLAGCAMAPVKAEIPLLGADLAARPDTPSQAKLLIFNSSNPVLYALTGSIEVRVDGRGVATLAVGEYVQVPIPRGTHTIDLAHWDFVTFRTTHSVEVTSSDLFLEVFATPVANEVRMHPALPPQSELPRSFRAHLPK
jgi:hypothetical protein